MSKLETNTIDTISGSTTLTLGGTNATTIAQDSATTVTGFKSTGIDDNATSTAITIDSSENVGIKTTTPATELDISSGATTGGTKRYITLTSLNASSSEVAYADVGATFNQNTAGNESGGMDFRCVHNGSLANRYSFGGGAGDIHAWYTGASTERMRIDSNGLVSIGSTSTNARLFCESDNDSISTFRLNDTSPGSSGKNIAIFQRRGSNVGFVNVTDSSTSFVTSSDYRLKENVSYDFDATTRLKQLKPARFNFISDTNKTVDGFLAHEVSSIVPEAITGEKDATETKEKVVVNANGQVIAENIEQADWETGKIADEDGNTKYPTDSTWEATKVVPVYQGIDQSKLVPILTKALQEAVTKIETLEARITALENA